MSHADDPAFARHVFTLRAGDRRAVPDTKYEVALPDDAIDRRSYEHDGTTTTTTTCRVEVHEGGARVHTELVVEGETAWFRDLELRVVTTRPDDAVDLEVVRAPYTSIPPKPAT